MIKKNPPAAPRRRFLIKLRPKTCGMAAAYIAFGSVFDWGEVRVLEVEEMRNSISKTIVAGLAALAMSAAVIAPAAPASAAQWRGGGFGGWHGGGWHGGGWHAGGWGWRGGFRPGWGGWHGAWNGGRTWHPGYWRGGVWYNGWWGPAIVAGLAAGALATYPYWGGYGYGYGDGCWAYQPTYDAYGRYLGQQYVNIC